MVVKAVVPLGPARPPGGQVHPPIWGYARQCNPTLSPTSPPLPRAFNTPEHKKSYASLLPGRRVAVRHDDRATDLEEGVVIEVAVLVAGPDGGSAGGTAMSWSARGRGREGEGREWGKRKQNEIKHITCRDSGGGGRGREGGRRASQDESGRTPQTTPTQHHQAGAKKKPGMCGGAHS